MMKRELFTHLNREAPPWLAWLAWLLLVLAACGAVQIVWMLRHFNQVVAFFQWLVYGGS